MTELLLSSMPFSEASAFWLEQHKRYIKPNTLKNYQAAVKLQVANLGDVIVKDIHIGHIRAYQAERAKSLGCHYPGDYLFPYQTNRALWDPRRPASKSWLRNQISRLREVTGVDHINPHVFRHLAVTELLEKGAKEQTVIAVAGWVGRRMIEHYSHPRMEAKADAVGLLEKSGHMAPERSAQRPAGQVAAPQPAIPDMSHPAVRAEIARQVELLLQSRAARPRTPDRRVARRRVMMHGRRLARGPISRA